MRRYVFVEHTADVAVEITGDSLEELFLAAFDGWKQTVSFSNWEIGEKKKINISADSNEELLVEFLNEINYLLLTKKWGTERIEELKIVRNKNSFYLNTFLNGREIDLSKTPIKEEIKAVTYGGLKIKSEGGKYSTRLIFDV
jgi:SHS2 domain-containing protein